MSSHVSSQPSVSVALAMLAGVAAWTGCQFDPSGLGPGGGPPVDADVSLVDGGPLDGPAAEIDAELPDECEADTITCLDSDLLGTCRDDGSGYDVETCPFACVSEPEPHCVALVPSNGIPPALLDLGTDDKKITGTGTVVFDTDSGRIFSGDEEFRPGGTGLHEGSGIGFEVVAQTDAPGIGVFAVASLQVEAGTRIRGIGSNAMAIVADGEIVISGVIDVTGGTGACRSDHGFNNAAQCPGPGGFAGGRDETAGAGPGGGERGTGGGGSTAEAGGGGGGHGAAGGDGGQAAGHSSRSAGGQPFASEALTPLTGGGGGGGGGDDGGSGPGAAGGGGGGALQLVSRTAIRLRTEDPGADCGINAGGGGAGTGGGDAGGGGGGAGGGVLLEAPEVEHTGDCVIAANGGGGSGAGADDPGQTGLLSDQPAAGSDGEGRDRGPGGDGGAQASPAGATAEDRSGDDTGGGGGGVGAIRVNTLDGSGFDEQGTVSPAPGTGALTVE